jgi:DNA-binding NtrC family response regulator
LQRSLAMAENNSIQVTDLPELISPLEDDPAAAESLSETSPAKLQETGTITANIENKLESSEEFSLEKHLEEIETAAIKKALEETRWNKTAAAKKLGMTFRSFRYRLKNSVSNNQGFPKPTPGPSILWAWKKLYFPPPHASPLVLAHPFQQVFRSLP